MPPHLSLIATGGTIAGNGDLDRYSAATIGPEALLHAVPGLCNLARWHIEQAFALDSRDIQPGHWLQLATRIRALIDEPEIDGIVITHGTDTLEETAFALHLLLPTAKPVVLTAAMRPADSLSADGPLNLLQAARVAIDPTSVGRGVLVVANDHIHSARFIAKTHTHAPNALTTPGDSAEGRIFDRAIRYLRPPQAPRAAILNVPADTALPRVDILMAYAGMPADLLQSLAAAGARGIVLALAGHGSIPATLRTAIAHVQAQGLTVVRASRIGAGVMRNHNENDDALNLLAAEQLNALQARIFLMLALAAGLEMKEITALLARL